MDVAILGCVREASEAYCQTLNVDDSLQAHGNIVLEEYVPRTRRVPQVGKLNDKGFLHRVAWPVQDKV